MKIYESGVNVVVDREDGSPSVSIPQSEARLLTYKDPFLGVFDERTNSSYVDSHTNIFDQAGDPYGPTWYDTKEALRQFVGEVPPGSGGGIQSVTSDFGMVDDTDPLNPKVLLPFIAKFTFDTGLVNDTGTISGIFDETFTIPNGDYEIMLNYVWSHNAVNSSFFAFLEWDQGNGTWVQLDRHVQEPKDRSGSGEVLPSFAGGTTNSGTSQRFSHVMRVEVLADGGIKGALAGRFRLNMVPTFGVKSTIYKAYLTIKKIG